MSEDVKPRREGQERVEVRPGAFIWMDAAMKKAHEARRAAAASQEPAAVITTPKPTSPEAATVTPGENAAQPAAKARKAS